MICIKCQSVFHDEKHKTCAWCRRKRICPGCGGWRWDISAVCRNCKKTKSGPDAHNWKGGPEAARARKFNTCACGNKKLIGSRTCKACYKPHWKGGRIVNGGGYVMIYSPGHPRLDTNKGPAQYIQEHVLVMEKHLGRYLTRDENVHHLNGDKQDNRIENLELWSVSQPPGQRVEDKIAWAKEILRQYEGEQHE